MTKEWMYASKINNEVVLSYRIGAGFGVFAGETAAEAVKDIEKNNPGHTQTLVFNHVGHKVGVLPKLSNDEIVEFCKGKDYTIVTRGDANLWVIGMKVKPAHSAEVWSRVTTIDEAMEIVKRNE